MIFRVIVSRSIRSVGLKMLHIAHPGICHMVQLARRYIYWPAAMHDDIKKFVKNCYHCTKNCNQTALRENEIVLATIWEKVRGVFPVEFYYKNAINFFPDLI